MQFELLKSVKGKKRIVSFGGWSFSTEADTYPIFREGVTDANRQTFADNVAAFVKEHDLDGVDFDWEYPGAPDIPGIPPGSEEDGANYVKFLKMIRKALPDGKTVSIAAPASYWYLKGFDPIEDFEPLLDYMIYMTYDLHGQWDYGNEYANPGCPKGNCLRSHVNLTETKTALSMITKAGMRTDKVIVGTVLYGRSFKMAKEGCKCVGPESGAAKGRCTDTRGYISNVGIKEIIDKNPTAEVHLDKESGTEILVYDDTEWVAYYGDALRNDRIAQYIDWGFRGFSDWAVDLQESDIIDKVDFAKCDGDYDSLDDIVDDLDNIPDHCLVPYTLPVLSSDLKKALDKYQDLIDDGYDDKFKVFAKYAIEAINPQLQAFMSKNANDYFHCLEEKQVWCCADCNYATCLEDCDKDCDEGESGVRNTTISCPDTPPPAIVDGNEGDHSIYFMMDDEKGFLKGIGKDYGLLEDMVTYEPYIVKPQYGCGTDDDYSCNKYWFNYPVHPDDVEIHNPKDIISDALKNLTRVQNRLAEAADDVYYGFYPGSTADVLTAVELPVFMSEAAIESMQKVADKAEEIKEEDRKTMIIGFATSLIMLLPVVGEVVAATRPFIGFALGMAGTAGDTALNIWSIVYQPDGAAMTIIVALVGYAAPKFSEAATKRRGMSPDTAKAINDFVKERHGQFDKIQYRPCARYA